MSGSTGRTNPSIGPLVRLRGLPHFALPLGGIGIHPDGTEENLNAGAQIHPTKTVATFITDVLTESSLFIDGVESESGTWRADKVGIILSRRNKIQFYKRVVSARDINRRTDYSRQQSVKDDEVWYARRSLHHNSSRPGTANWNDFTRDMKNDHAQTEAAVSDDVTAKNCMRWDTNNLVVNIRGEQWNNITMAVVEMRHKMPPMVHDRTFPVVLITASPNRSVGHEFLVISIPIIDFETTAWAQLTRERNHVVAAYASIERFRTINGDIEWVMATASDPKGKISHFTPGIEGTAMPIVIKKDVEKYMRWVDRRRRGQPQEKRPSLFARGATFIKNQFRILSQDAVIPPRH